MHAWRAKARCNIVPAERLHELFEELKFSPTEKQSEYKEKEPPPRSSNQYQLINTCIHFLVNEMLQTAKLFARRGSDAATGSTCYKHMNGLTFGEFCVLAADLKRFRTQNSLQRNQSSDDDVPHVSSVRHLKIDELAEEAEAQAKHDQNAPEVFLGGSCNPTTWRADTAIPTLDKLGISFYNPVGEA